MMDKLYCDNATVRFVNNNSHKTQTFHYHPSVKFKKIFGFHSRIPNINSYIEKYPDEKHVDRVILDFDGDDYDKVYYEVKGVSNSLASKGLTHYIVNSTNKGCHLYIMLPNAYDFCLNNDFKVNNRMFKRFVKELVFVDCDYLDEVNIGLRTNIRMVGSIHPKSGKEVEVMYVYNGDDDEGYCDKCYEIAINSSEEVKYGGHWHKIINYDSDIIDLRTLPWDGKKETGASVWAICPWHNDSHPSLRVYEKRAYCQRCGPISFNEICDYFGIKR